MHHEHALLLINKCYTYINEYFGAMPIKIDFHSHKCMHVVYARGYGNWIGKGGFFMHIALQILI